MNSKGTIIAVLVVIIVGAAVFGAVTILTYNNLVSAELQAENKWNAIKIQFERKIDLIPQLKDTVQKYGDYEQGTLALIIQLRTQWLNSNRSVMQQVNISTYLNQALSTLFSAVAENYPSLKADTLYQSLFDEITGTENRITMAKLDYNNMATAYNTALAGFPGNMIGPIFGLKKMPLY